MKGECVRLRVGNKKERVLIRVWMVGDRRRRLVVLDKTQVATSPRRVSPW